MKDTHTPAFIAGVTYTTRGGWHVTVARINNNGTITDANGCCYWPDGRVCKREERKGDLMERKEDGMADTSKQTVDRFIAQYIDGAHGCQMDWEDAQSFAKDLKELSAKLAEVKAERDEIYERWNDCQEKRIAAETALTAARAALVTARNDALEEAWSAVGDIPCKVGKTKHYWKCQDAIRALATPQEKADE